MKKAITLVLVLAGVAGLIGVSQYRSSHAKVDVNVAKVQRSSLSDTILASGNLVFNTQIQIRSEVTGRVEAVLVEEGQLVTAGQMLMRLDQAAFKADVERASAVVTAQRIDIERTQALADNLHRQLVRQQQLLAQKLVQQETVDTLQNQLVVAQINIKASRAALEQAEADLALSEDRLKKTIFIAPIDGLMAAVDVKVGETVIAGTTNIVGSDLMTLADPSAILAELRVDEADISRIELGLATDVFAAANPKQALKGKVVSIGTSAKRLTQGEGLAFRVKVLLDALDGRLYPGMSCRAEIIIGQSEPTLNVPVSAVIQQDQQQFVWKVNEQRAEKVAVTLGVASDIEQAVLTGLSEGEQVIIGPARTMKQLTPGTAVQVVERKDD